MCIYFFSQGYRLTVLKDPFFPSLPPALTHSPFPQAGGCSRQKESPTYRGTLSPTLGKNPSLVVNPYPLPRYSPTAIPRLQKGAPSPQGGQSSSAYRQGLPRHNLAALTGYRRPSPPTLRPSPARPRARALTKAAGCLPGGGRSGNREVKGRERRGRRRSPPAGGPAPTWRRVTSSWQKSLLGAGACPRASNSTSCSSDAILGRWKAVSMATRKRRTSRGVTGSPAPS